MACIGDDLKERLRSSENSHLTGRLTLNGQVDPAVVILADVYGEVVLYEFGMDRLAACPTSVKCIRTHRTL